MRQITPLVWLATGGAFSILCLGRGMIPLAAWLVPRSVTGVFGIAFLIAWSASVVNWAWDHDFQWDAIRGGVLL